MYERCAVCVIASECLSVTSPVRRSNECQLLRVTDLVKKCDKSDGDGLHSYSFPGGGGNLVSCRIVIDGVWKAGYQTARPYRNYCG